MTDPEVKPEEMTDKPQLHGDSLIRPKFELQGEDQRPQSAVSELPAREPVGSEMEAQGSSRDDK
jgi:hypothetical protein